MSVQTRKLYDSANGDCWYLAHDPANSWVFVRHEPNRASGGRISDTDIGTFLSRGGQGPEKQELLRLIGSLVDEISKCPSGTVHEDAGVDHGDRDISRRRTALGN